ncbi:gag-pol fusion protein [Pelomyxa schiedti]|nr:gag-pol fusion protein [Pelomyxa schiedti]
MERILVDNTDFKDLDSISFFMTLAFQELSISCTCDFERLKISHQQYLVIEPSVSPWAAPVVLVNKPYGTYRFCVDYRKLNDVTKKMAYPMPRIDDMLDALVNAPATFQKLLDLILAGLTPEHCLVYIDDVIIFSRGTLVEHLSWVRKPPVNQKGVRSFLGIVGYYRRFIKGFAKISTPLEELKKKDIEWHWEEAEQKPFTIETDASITALSATLTQRDDEGQIHPIAFASRKLRGAEVRYHITQLEALAVEIHDWLDGHCPFKNMTMKSYTDLDILILQMALRELKPNNLFLFVKNKDLMCKWNRNKKKNCKNKSALWKYQIRKLLLSKRRIQN